jgi:hypothetical protein
LLPGAPRLTLPKFTAGVAPEKLTACARRDVPEAPDNARPSATASRPNFRGAVKRQRIGPRRRREKGREARLVIAIPSISLAREYWQGTCRDVNQLEVETGLLHCMVRRLVASEK